MRVFIIFGVRVERGKEKRKIRRGKGTLVIIGTLSKVYPKRFSGPVELCVPGRNESGWRWEKVEDEGE